MPSYQRHGEVDALNVHPSLLLKAASRTRLVSSTDHATREEATHTEGASARAPLLVLQIHMRSPVLPARGADLVPEHESLGATPPTLAKSAARRVE